MPTLKGTWYFKNKLDLDQSDVYFCISFPDYENMITPMFFEANGAEFHTLHICGRLNTTQNADGNFPPVVYGDGFVFPYGTEDGSEGVYGTWHEGYQKITFLHSIEVSEEFYNWFIKNAVPLTIEGTWRFNKTLVSPTNTNIFGQISLASDIKPCFTSSHYSEYTADLSFIDIFEPNTGLELNVYIASSDDDANVPLWKATSGWVSEKARLLTFSPNTVLGDPEFALWFYENAHPTEVVLCSEAYVAEIAHNIRQIKGTTQRYAVKNLANEIRNLYINANEEVY